MKPARPAELADDDPMLDIIYVGDQGKLMGDRLIPESRMETEYRDYGPYPPPPHHAIIPTSGTACSSSGYFVL